MIGGAAVAATLERLGVRHVFGVVSVHNLPTYDAITHASAIDMIATRHEQGAVHAADAYARASGRLGVALVSTGPGTANAMGGLFEAAAASSPVLLLTGQVPSSYYGKRKGALHEAETQVAMLRSLCRSVASVRRADDIAPLIEQVVREMRSGRNAPGAVEIPIDFQYREVAAPSTEPIARPSPSVPDAADIRAAAELLRSAARPLLYVGGGVVAADAQQALARLARLLAAPVLTTINGRGAMPEDDPLCLGAFHGRAPELLALLESADVMLAVGTRFQGLATRFWKLPMPRRLIHLDADPGVIGTNYPVELALVGDARVGLELLADAVGTARADGAFAAQARAGRDTARAAARTRIGPDHAAIMDTLRELLPRDANVIRDATVPAYLWGDRLLPVFAPRTSIHPVTGAIGPGLPFAIGAAAATKRRTLLIQGDGGLMLSVGELATLAELRLPVLVCVFNDRGYGIIRVVEQRRFGRTSGADLATPDIAALARAFGIPAERVASVSEFRAAATRAVRDDGPTVIEVDLGALASPDVAALGSESS